MLTALRRRLTLLMTALTSLVLAGALVVTWNYAAAQYRTAAETLLTQNFSAIVDRLDSADSVSDAWLADQEHNSGCLLFLWDNGAALHFAGTTGSADARNAVEPLLEEGLSPLLDTSLHDSSGAVQRQSAVFTLNEYRCHAALLPRGTAGSYLLVAALQDMGFVHCHAVQTVVQYGAIWFTGTLLLAIISWRLTEAQAQQSMEAALAAQDWELAFRASHTLKGVAGNLGLLPLSRAVCAIVEPLRAREARDYGALYQAVLEEFRRADAFRECLRRNYQGE